MKLSINALIQVQDQCSHCRGEGALPNPVWDEFNQAMRAGTANIDEMEHWFEERGLAAKREMNGRLTTLLPKEEITCAECEGEGKIRTLISIAQLRALLSEGTAFPEETRAPAPAKTSQKPLARPA